MSLICIQWPAMVSYSTCVDRMLVYFIFNSKMLPYFRICFCFDFFVLFQLLAFCVSNLALFSLI